MSRDTITQAPAHSGQASKVSVQRSAIMPAISHKYGLLAILTAFVGLGLFYDFTVPLFEKPDELKHFALIQFIQTERQLPIVREGVYRPYDQEGTQPPLYHILAAAAVAWLDLSDFEEPPRNPHYADDRSFVWRERGNNNLYLHPPNENFNADPVIWAARLSRWLSLLAGVATIVLTYVLARLVFDNAVPQHAPASTGKPKKHRLTGSRWPVAAHTYLPLVAAALVAFVPQFLHVNSAITNDSLSTTLAAAALVGLALVIKQGASSRKAVYLGLALGLGAITKLSLIYLWPVTGLVFAADVFRRGLLHRRAWLDLFKFGAIIAGLILLIAGWWYWRNWQIYGDLTALNAHLFYRGGPLDPPPTLAQLWQTELTGLELSFWAAFGAGQVFLEPGLYALLRWIKVVVFVGLVIGIWRFWRGWRSQSGVSTMISQASSPKLSASDQDRTTSYFLLPTSGFTLRPASFVLLLMLILWALIIFAALLRWMQITPASWGRLLFPALPALGVLTAFALSEIGLLLSNLLSRPLRTTHYALHSLIKRDFQGAARIPYSVFRIFHDAIRNTQYLLPLSLALLLLTLSLIAPFRYIRPAYAKTPLVTEAEVPNDLERLDFTFDGALRLIGYKIEQDSVRPGDWLPVTLYWQAIEPLDANYSAFVHVLTPEGESIGQANTYPDGGNWPTSMLPVGQVLPDTYHVFIPPDAEAPLLTRLAVGIFEFDDPQRAAKPAVDQAGQAVEVIVEGAPLLPREWPSPEPSTPLEVDFGGKIRLIGYDRVNENWKPGSQMPITFYWKTLDPPGQNLNLFIHLIDPVDQTQAAGFDGPPRFPTSAWQPGYIIEDTRILSLPAEIPPGNYELHIGWYNLDDFARLPVDQERAANGSLQLLEVMIE